MLVKRHSSAASVSFLCRINVRFVVVLAIISLYFLVIIGSIEFKLADDDKRVALVPRLVTEK